MFKHSRLLSLGCLFCLLVVSLNAEYKRKVIVGVFDHKPLIFIENNQVQGFYADIINEIAKKEKWEISYVYGSWNEGLEGIEHGDLDLITSVAYTSERDTFMDYSQIANVTVWGQLYTHKRNKINSLFDLANKNVAIMENDFSGNYFKNMCQNLNLKVNFIEVPSFKHVFYMIENRQVIAGVTNNVFGYNNENSYLVNRTQIIFNPFQLYFTVKKGENQDIIATLDRYFLLWKEDQNSIYYQALDKWLTPASSDKEKAYNKSLKIIIISLCSLLFIAFLNILFYRLKVKKANKIIKSKSNDILTKDSELSQAREEMIFKENKLKQLAMAIEQISEGVLITEINGDIIYANPTFYRFCDLDQNTAINQRLNAFDILSLNEENRSNLITHLMEGKSVKEILPIIRKDNTIILIENMVTPIKNQEREIVQFIAIASDITQQVKMQDQLKQMQKMEAIGQLAGGIAHDLNNVLTPILGNVEIALLDDKLSSDIIEDLDEIKKCSLKAKSLIQQLLAFSRKQILKMEVINLPELVYDLEKMLKRLIRENISIKIHCQENIHKIKADQTQLQQAIINLCVNSKDAISEDGEILIDISNMYINESYIYQHSEIKKGDYVLLSVSDNGLGISKANLEHIFEPFFTTKEVGKGTGLGLATVFGIVKQHNGYVYVYSEKNIGTTFKIYLPATKEKLSVTTVEEVHKVEQKTGTECVIIAEDDEDIRTFIFKALKSVGYEVLLSENTSNCLELIKQNKDKVDLLITDIIMPQMNGLMLYKKAKLIAPQLKVLYMSGYEETVLAPDSTIDPSIAYLSKPFTFEALCEKIRQALTNGTK